MLSSQYSIQQNQTLGYAGIQIFEDINTSADNSVRFGQNAGKLSYGTGNAFMGYSAGEQNLAGSYDTFIGYQAGQFNQNSDATTLVGAFAGRQNTSGNETVFVGYRAGEFNFNGNENVGIGAYALRENNSGSATTAVGWRAAERNLDGDYNTMIGAEAGQNNRSGNYNTMAGYRVGRATFAANENTFFGAYAGYSNELGSDNCLIGFKAGLDVINGNFNIAIGAYSLATGRVNANVPSDCNVVIGAFTNTTGSGNVVLGLNAGSNSTGDDNVLIGKDVAMVYDGHKSVVIGAYGLIQGSGECNTMIGYNVAPDFITGSNNVFIGVGANTQSQNIDVSYAIAIATSNVQTFSHSIAIGDGIDNKRRETIVVGFDINSDAENSVLIGKSLNIRNATVFKDPISYPYIATIDTKADELFGPTDIQYSYLLQSPSPSNTIYTTAGAGQFTSNLISSRGNRKIQNVSSSSNYNLITVNNRFTHSYIHQASSYFINDYDNFNTVIPADDIIRIYNKYGTSFDVTSNIADTSNINSYSNLYETFYKIPLNYENTNTLTTRNNVVTNLTYFNTSNTEYNIYIQKQVQFASFTNDTISNNNNTELENGLLYGSITCDNLTLDTAIIGTGIHPSNIHTENASIKYITNTRPQYGFLQNNIYTRTYQQAITLNSDNLSDNLHYTPFIEYAYSFSQNNDRFKLYPYLEIHNRTSNTYGITSNGIESCEITISLPNYASNIIVRNNIIFAADNELHTYRFSSNDFVSIPYDLSPNVSFTIDNYDTTYFELIQPSIPFTYSNIKAEHVYLTQKIAASSYVQYEPISGTITNDNGNTIPFNISVASIPSTLYNIPNNYTIPLTNTGISGNTSIASIYTLPNIPITKLWTIKASSNSDLQLSTGTVTNLNQNTYRRLNPFIPKDDITMVIQKDSSLQEVNVSFQTPNNYIFNATTQHSINAPPVTTTSIEYQKKDATIESPPIVHTSNLYTSNITINMETNTNSINNNNYQYITSPLINPYDNTTGYSNVYTFLYVSNVYPIDKQTNINPDGEVTILSSLLTSNFVYDVDHSLIGDPEYTSNLLYTRSYQNEIEPFISYTSNIIYNLSNVIFYTQAYNNNYEQINQIQPAFYNYGVIQSYETLLLYSSNTTSNESAYDVIQPRTFIENTAVIDGSTHYTHITSNILQFNVSRTSNSVIPMTKAMMYKDGGEFSFSLSAKNNFDAIAYQQGIVNSWTQSQIDSGQIYLQLPITYPNITDISTTIRENITSSTYTINFTLYNKSIMNTLSYTPEPYYLSDKMRYINNNKSVRGIYNIYTILQDLKNKLQVNGFPNASQFFVLYTNSNVDMLSMNNSLVPTDTVNLTNSHYLVRTNQHASNTSLQLFAINSTNNQITNLLSVPILFNEIQPEGITKQGFNYGISAGTNGSKNILDPEIFSYSYSNLADENIRFDITSILANVDFDIYLDNNLLTDVNKQFTYKDCRDGKIRIEPRISDANNAISYDIINTIDNSTLVTNQVYNLSTYEYYAFPTISDVGSKSSFTTMLYGSNLVANIFSDILSSNIDQLIHNNPDVSPSNLYIYIEKPGKKGVFYNEYEHTIPYLFNLQSNMRYISYTPDDIQHDTIDIRLGYKTSNISPIYSISLSNYAIPIASNIPFESSYSSNLPIQSIITSSSKNIDRFISDGYSFSSNSLPIVASNTFPFHTYNFPISILDNQQRTIASTYIDIQPFVLSSVPYLNDTQTTTITINVSEFNQASLKSLLDLVNTDRNWNAYTDFVLTLPTDENNVNTSIPTQGIVMKKSYILNEFNQYELQLTPVSHFTKTELIDDLIVYQHIGHNGNTTIWTDEFTCYTTNGEYNYNPTLLTVYVNISPIPYIQSLADDYVYYNTIHEASNSVNLLNNVITINNRYISNNIVPPQNLSLCIGSGSTSNVDIVDIRDVNNILQVFSIDDLNNGYIGYKIQSNYLQTRVNVSEISNIDLWPFTFEFIPNGLSTSTHANELISIPAYSNIFDFHSRATLNIFESSNAILYPPIPNQNYSYTFSSSELFTVNPVDIIFQINPKQSLITTNMQEIEYIDSAHLRTFEFDIKLGSSQYDSNIFHATCTHSNIIVHTPVYHYQSLDAIQFDKWNTITINSVDSDQTNNASIFINSYPIYLDQILYTSNLKYISLDFDETKQNNYKQNVYETSNIYGDLSLFYLLTNYATVLNIRNFELDIFNPYNSTSNYDPYTNNVVLGKNILIKGTDNITLGKQFSTAGRNNIIVGNYIGIDVNNVVGTNDIYESIIVGNNSFINSTVRDIIAIGNSNFNNLNAIDPTVVNDFIAQRPIIIGNSFTSDYIDYHINIGNSFLKTSVGNSQVYLGLNDEKTVIGYNRNMKFAEYQDLYVAHGILIGHSVPGNSNQMSLSVIGNANITNTLTASNINFTGGLFYNGVPYSGGGGNSQWITTGNDIYYNSGSVGIGTTMPNNNYALDVIGNINFTGNLYQNGVLFSGSGGGYTSNVSGWSNLWKHSSNETGLIIPGSGSVSYISTSNAIYKHTDNNIDYGFDIAFTITNGSDGVDDYKLSVPYEVDTSYYTSNSIIGSAWSLIVNGGLSNYFPVSVRSPVGANQSNVIVRFMNATTETSFSTLPSGTKVQLSGLLTYVSTNIVPNGSDNWIKTDYGIYTYDSYDSYNSYNVGIGTTIPNYKLDVFGSINFTSNLYQRDMLIDLTQINIATSNINKVNPWISTPTPAQILVPSPGTVSISSTSNALYRFIDNDVEYAFNFTSTITQGSGVGAGDYKLSLPVPICLDYYTTNAILGTIWSRVTVGTITNYIPITVSSLSENQSNEVAIRFLNGTTETPMDTLPTGSVLQLSGMLEYVAPIYPRSGIFLSNVCYQDDYGHVGFNTFGPLQGQVDIVANKTDRAALYVQQQNTGPIGLFLGNGNIGIGTIMPLAKLHVESSIYAAGNIGIGVLNPAYQLQLSIDSAFKPTTNTWSTTSDIRLKDDVTVADYKTCYDTISKLDLKYYKWREEVIAKNDTKDHHKLGWIAQEVEEIFPNSVDIIPEFYGLSNIKTLNTDQIYASMYGTIKYLIEENRQLKQSLLEIQNVLHKNGLM